MICSVQLQRFRSSVICRSVFSKLTGKTTPFLHSHCIILSWRSCWCCCRSSRRKLPPPPSRWARLVPRCTVTKMYAGSPSFAGAMTNVPVATTQTNIIIMLISSAGRNLKNTLYSVVALILLMVLVHVQGFKNNQKDKEQRRKVSCRLAEQTV